MDDPKTCPFFTDVLYTGKEPEPATKVHVRATCFKERCELWVEYWIYPELVEMDTLPNTPLKKEKRGCCAHRFKAIQGSFSSLAFVGVVV